MNRWIPILSLLSVATALHGQPASGEGTATPSREAREMVWEGNRLYAEGHYAEAEIFYRKGLEAEGALPESAFNLGAATYEQDRFEEAAGTWAGVAENPALPADVRADAWYNRGNALYEQEQYGEAFEAYKNALRLRPEHEAARHNLALARRREQEQQQEQQQQQQQDQQQQQQQQPQDGQEGEQDQQQQPQDGDEGQDREGQEGQPDQPGDPGDRELQPGQTEERSLSPEELERILDALEQDERQVQQKINAQKKPARPGKADKDW